MLLCGYFEALFKVDFILELTWTLTILCKKIRCQNHFKKRLKTFLTLPEKIRVPNFSHFQFVFWHANDFSKMLNLTQFFFKSHNILNVVGFSLLNCILVCLSSLQHSTQSLILLCPVNIKDEDLKCICEHLRMLSVDFSLNK